MISNKLLDSRPELDIFIKSWIIFLETKTTKYQDNKKIMKKINKLFIAINFLEMNSTIYLSFRTYRDIIIYNKKKSEYDEYIYESINIMIYNQESKEYVL